MTSPVPEVPVRNAVLSRYRSFETTAVAFIFVAYTLVYFVSAIRRASSARPWLDEVLTLWICRLPTMADVWRVLHGSPDSAPPAWDLICRGFMALTGNDYLGIRMLAILGFYAAQVAIFLFVRARFAAVFAALAML